MSKIEVNEIDAQSGSTITVGSACKSVAVPGNVLKTNAVQASDAGNIISQSGTTITIGASGDTISLASGASQTGFGREGSVDWQTSIKTATFTAASGEGYFCNTSGGAFTVNLPSSPSVGDIVAIKDYASTFDTNNLTIGRGGSNMNGNATDSVRNTDNESLTLVYADATKGWLAVEEGTGYVGEKFIVATGGTITCSGDYKIHTFTGPGTFTVSQTASAPASNSIDYLVVAGGGGGKNAPGNGVGGGAGGFRLSNSTCMPAFLTSPLATPTGLPVTVTGYPITVGGGAPGDPASPGTPTSCRTGSNSIFSTIIAAGGGGGGNNCNLQGGAGGSGGGTSRNGTSLPNAGAGNTPPVSPPQGNPGAFHPGVGDIGGGGGGAGGTTPAPSISGDGGAGSYVVGAGFAGCNGTTGPVCGARYFTGGGVGGHNPTSSPGASQTAGVGGGGGQNPSGGVAGSTNTGGGGGAGDAAGPIPAAAGGGGSGIVIIRYKFQN